MTNETLIGHAKQAMGRAYAPYSGFQVGAALLTKDGQVFYGCNIENASYGATNCAERTAIFKAVSEGQREFDKIAVVCSENRKAYPCGICLQVMSEFMPDGMVLLEDSNGIETLTVKELLPAAFQLKESSDLRKSHTT